MRVKNVSGGPLDVPMLDRRVEADEVVDVPDFQPAHNPIFVYTDENGKQQQRPSREGDPDYLAIVWPPDKWEPVITKKAAPPVQAAAIPEPAQPDQAPPSPPAPVSSDPRERR